MRCEDCRDALGAYLDGELMPDEEQAIGDHLALCGPCASEHAQLMTLSRSLKEGLVRYPAPDVLKARIRSAIAQPGMFEPARPRQLPWAGLVAAGLVIAALSGVTSFAIARRGPTRDPMSEQVLASHIRSLMPGHLTDVASNDQHNVKPWFNGRLDLSPVVPRLDSAGFPLVGGRLDYVGGRPVAAVVYSRRRHIINVFSWPVEAAGALRPSHSSEKGYQLIRWSDGGTEFWAASDLARPELDQFVALFARADSATISR